MKMVLIPHLKRLNGSMVPDYCAISESVTSNECPSSEWQSLVAFESITNNSNPPAGYLMYHERCSPYATQLTGRSSLRQFMMAQGLDPRPGAIPKLASGTTQHSVIADALTNTAVLWDLALGNATSGSTHGSPYSDQRAATHAVKQNYRQPYAVAICSGKMYLNKTEGAPIIFPLSSGGDGNTTVPIDDISKMHANGSKYYGISPTQLLQDPKSSYLDYRLKWVELPKDPFNGLGAIILPPRGTDNASQSLYTCTISAEWRNFSLSTSTGFAVEPVSSQAYMYATAQQSVVEQSFYQLRGSSFQESWMQGIWGSDGEGTFSEKPINITAVWADFLNPFVPSINSTTFNALMSLEGIGSRPVTTRIAFILVGLMTNGLARVAFKNSLQGGLRAITNPKTNSTVIDGNHWLSGKGDVFTVDPVESKDWAKFLVESGIQGYAYNTSGAAPKVAIGFLLAYCAFAISHVFYAGFSGITLLLPVSASQ